MKAILLDRDGVVNEDRADYVKGLDELVILPRVPEAISAFTESGYKVFILSNQAGLSKGLFTVKTLEVVDQTLKAAAKKVGGEIEKIYYCPHQTEDNCACRKPKPGLFEKLFIEYPDIIAAETYYIGDSQRDVTAAKRAGCKALLVLTGRTKKGDIGQWTEQPDLISQNLYEAAQCIISHK